MVRHLEKIEREYVLCKIFFQPFILSVSREKKTLFPIGKLCQDGVIVVVLIIIPFCRQKSKFSTGKYNCLRFFQFFRRNFFLIAGLKVFFIIAAVFIIVRLQQAADRHGCKYFIRAADVVFVQVRQQQKIELLNSFIL